MLCLCAASRCGAEQSRCCDNHPGALQLKLLACPKHRLELLYQLMATMLRSHLERVQPAGRQVAHEADRAKLAGAHHAVRLQLAKQQPQLAKPGPRTAITVPQLGWRRSRRQHGRWRLLQRRRRGAVPRRPDVQSALRAALGNWSEVELGKPQKRD